MKHYTSCRLLGYTPQHPSCSLPMYRITIACRGLCEEDCREGPAAVIEEFKERPWHTDVTCEWSNGVLRIAATNDYDPDGQALLDEYWDAVFGCVLTRSKEGGSFDIESVVEIDG